MRMAWIILALPALLLRPVSAPAQELEDRDPTFQAGRAALEDGLYDIAEKRFDEYIRSSLFRGKRALGTLYLVQAMNAQGKNEDVVRWLDDHQSWLNTEYQGGLQFWRARALTDLGRYAEALEILTGYEDRYSDARFVDPALRLRAQVYARMNQPERALAEMAEFDRRRGESPEAPGNLLDWSALLIQRGETARAESVLERLLDRFPADAASHEARLQLGRLRAARAQWADADKPLRELAESALAPVELRASAWLIRAAAREAESNLAQAVAACVEGEKLTREPATQLHGRILRARFLDLLDRRAEAIALLEESIVKFPAEPERGEALIALADMRLKDRRPDLALEAFQNYLEAFSDPDGEARALLGKGRSLRDLGRYTEAGPVFEKAYSAQTVAEMRESALSLCAESLFDAGQYAAAQERFVKVKDEFPESGRVPEWLLRIAECDARLKRYREADGGLRFLAEQFPDSDTAERALFRLALLQEEQGLWEEAARVYDDFMLIYPRSARWPDALLGRGLARYRGGLFAEAQQDFETVVSRFPATKIAQRAFYLRAWCTYMRGDTRTALQIADTFLDQFPDSPWAPDVLFWKAEHHFNAGEWVDAEKLFNRIVRGYPQSDPADDALYWAGRAAFAQNDYRRALSYYDQLVRVFTNSSLIAEARFAQGDALTELGEFAGAIIAFDEVVKRFPGHPLADLAMGRKGDCQFTLGADRRERMSEAIASYRALLESPTASAELRQQAEFKLGRCFDKLNRRPEAFEHYMNVVYGWLTAQEAGRTMDPVWFMRSAFEAAAIKEAEGAVAEAIRIYQRVVDTGVPAGSDAQKRIERLRSGEPRKPER